MMRVAFDVVMLLVTPVAVPVVALYAIAAQRRKPR